MAASSVAACHFMRAVARRTRGNLFSSWRGWLGEEPIVSASLRRDEMDKDRVKGAANQAKGAVKQAAGSVTGDAKLKAEGTAQKAAGKVQNAVGGAKDAVRGK
jgi:uncharacterized protein YjbJ (UPF0337 family)